MVPDLSVALLTGVVLLAVPAGDSVVRSRVVGVALVLTGLPMAVPGHTWATGRGSGSRSGTLMALLRWQRASRWSWRRSSSG